MERVYLEGPWGLVYFPEGEREFDSPEDLANAELPQVPARVPGNVEWDLVQAGKLPDPYYGANILELQAYESHQWWYTTSFPTPADALGRDVRLVFEGLDCFATVWLNGICVGESANMLIEQAFDVGSVLRGDGGPNELAVRLRSAVRAARTKRYEPSQVAMATNYDQLHVRKAPHMYGWDIAPRAVSAGLWRPVRLDIHDPTELVDLAYARTTLHGDDATLWVSWRFQTDESRLDEFELRFEGVCGDHRFTHVERPAFVAGRSVIRIPSARLWWPKGYGEPNLYTVTCRLVHRDNVVDERTDVVGLRTVRLERSDITRPDEGGEFLFRINGEPIFCKGANWVPLDAFHGRDSERLGEVLRLCDDLGCNILRCWGGNVYEDTAFFRFCDEHGILVWQDFAFACAIYPQDEAFLAQVREEARAVVRKLRNHPSLILWCGDNEIDAAYVQHGLDPATNRITREVLPQVCAECDPYRPYLPSSPYVSPEAVKRGAADSLLPEQHLWGPRDYFKGTFYSENTAHFASEIGYHGCPNVSSIRRFIPEDRIWPWEGNEYWRIHCTDPKPGGGPFEYRVKLMADQVREMFGFLPESLPEFVLASQISQAEAKKYFIEMFRIAKWRKTGIIWWNVIDCWPQFSDAVVDYYFAKKLAYHYIKRVQAPFCIMLDEPRDWHCRVVASNDTREERRGEFRVVDAWSGEERLAGEFRVGPNINRELGRIRVSHGEHRLFLMTWEIDGRSGGNHYLLGKPPFSLDRYKEFLRSIASLPESFEADKIGL